MAKVKAPLLSMRATGTIGKNVVFGAWRGVPYARQHVIPANPKTGEQSKTRETFRWLNEVFKFLGPLAINPWNIAALGRPFTGRNRFIQSNLPLLRPELNVTLYRASDGARGGPSFSVWTANTGAGASGTIDFTVTPPTLPTGWATSKAVAHAIKQQDSHDILDNVMAEISDAVAPYAGTLTGLGSGTECVVSVWLEYTRDDGLIAISPSVSAVLDAQV